MKKQKTAFFLILVWVIGMVVVFSFPPSIKSTPDPQDRHSELRGISIPELTLNLTGQSPEVPAFKAQLNAFDLVSAQFRVDFVPPIRQYVSPSFFAKSRALFDQLITFFYFFHTW